MTHSYIAYIDETGDDGLTAPLRQPGGGGGSSHWFGIGATIWRLSRDLDMVACAKQILGELPERKRAKDLHFTGLDHSQRVMAVSKIAAQPLRIVSVFAYKPAILADNFSEKNQLYHYMARYLLERASWLCRDYRPKVPEGDGRVKIIFSRRGGMNYPEFQEYLRRMRGGRDRSVRIHWPVIDIDGVEALDHRKRYGLQIADVAIGGLRSALEPDIYGNVEPRFAEILKDRVYDREGKNLGYGAKLVPSVEDIIGVNRGEQTEARLNDWLRIFR